MSPQSDDFFNLGVMAEARRYNAFLSDTIRGAAGSSRAVLDFGAGTGTFADIMQAAGYRVSCVETETRLQEHLRRKGFEVHTEINGVSPGAFDFAYALNVLEHIEDDVGALRGVATALKPGGRLFIYVPAFMILFSSMDRKVGHLRRYRRSDLTKRVEHAGFTVERAEYVDSLGFPATLLYRLVGDPSGGISLPLLRLYDQLFFPISRAIDLLMHPFFGKSVLVTATKNRQA